MEKFKAAFCLIQHPDTGKYLAVARRGTTDQWGLPGGKVNEQEKENGLIGLKLAANRELKEETGYSVSSYSENFINKFIRVFENNHISCFWINYFDVHPPINYFDLYSPKKQIGDAGPVDWITQEELENGPFGEYNKALFDSLTINSDEELLCNIVSNIKYLKCLLEDVNSHWVYEDCIYRYYHQSFKVYSIQHSTRKITHELKRIGWRPLNKQFINLIENGTGIKFDLSHNADWDKHTLPQLQAFFHAKYMLEMIVKYGEQLAEAPKLLPSGWATILYLYDMR